MIKTEDGNRIKCLLLKRLCCEMLGFAVIVDRLGTGPLVVSLGLGHGHSNVDLVWLFFCLQLLHFPVVHLLHSLFLVSCISLFFFHGVSLESIFNKCRQHRLKPAVV